MSQLFGFHPSQSLSGWGGVFNLKKSRWISLVPESRNPFQGGVGFSTPQGIEYRLVVSPKSQSLSGWGGVFNLEEKQGIRYRLLVSQSLSGWGGVFNFFRARKPARGPVRVAIPFRVGWGFQQRRKE